MRAWKKVSDLFSVRTLQMLCVGAACATLVAQPSSAIFLGVSLIVYAIFLIFGVAIGFHRGLSHRSMPENSVWTWICLGIGVLTSLGKPLEWVLIHRMHHKYSDLPSDPHAPGQQGFWTVFLNRWHLPSAEEGGVPPQLSLVRDIVRSPVVKFYQQNYYYVLLAYVGTLTMSGGWLAVIYGYCWPVMFCVGATSLVNSVCHNGDVPKDCWWVAALTFGEGIHERHHLQPKQTNLSHAYYFDVSGWIMDKLWVVNREGAYEQERIKAVGE